MSDAGMLGSSQSQPGWAAATVAAQDRLPDQRPPPPETSAIFASASWMVKLADF